MKFSLLATAAALVFSVNVGASILTCEGGDLHDLKATVTTAFCDEAGTYQMLTLSSGKHGCLTKDSVDLKNGSYQICGHWVNGDFRITEAQSSALR